MAVKQLSDGNTDGTTLGQDASDLVGFHGADPSVQIATLTVATGATIATVVTAMQTLVAALKTKGLMGT